jgi:hypothetical protein
MDALLLSIVALYFLPTIVAGVRRHPNQARIAVLNIFLGWTFVGWVIALVWAVSALPTDAPRRRPFSPAPNSFFARRPREPD